MDARVWIVLGGLLGGLGVVAGAFGAHGLESALKPDEIQVVAEAGDWDRYERRLENFEVATRYQMYHAPALVLVGLLLGRRRSAALQLAGWLFLIGVVLFCGFLYAWVLTQVPWLVHVVPIGGSSLVLGWFALAAGGWSHARHTPAGHQNRADFP